MKLILLVLILQVCSNKLYSLEQVRGVAPEKLSLYDPSKKFTCLDGSAIIPFEQVNDDYCDCRDGSDEPGTSACLNSSFACLNLGYIVQYIPSSRVNDGICDCCDGSDEYNNKVTCENKCIALAAKMKEEEEKMKKLREEGSIRRQELIQQGSEFKKALEAKIKELEEKKVNLENQRSKLEEKKNEAEQKAKEAKEIQDKILEEKAKELEKIELARKAQVLFNLLDLDKNLFLTPDELVKQTSLDILFDNDGQFTIEESIRLLDQNNQVSLELFTTTYYEKISPHVKLEETKKEENQEQPAEQEPEQNAENGEHLEEHVENGEHDHEHADHEHEHDQNTEHVQEDHPKESESGSKYDQETQKLIDESEEAKRLYQDVDRDFRDVEREISDNKKKLELDLGTNGEFASMIDKCFEFEDREYVYKLCPFDRTVQKSKTGHGETNIGNWRSWGEGQNKYLSMVFDNGLACWNGPQRSCKIHLTCGTENKLTSVAEPNRCEYEMKFETPAVCEENELKELKHEEL